MDNVKLLEQSYPFASKEVMSLAESINIDGYNRNDVNIKTNDDGYSHFINNPVTVIVTLNYKNGDRSTYEVMRDDVVFCVISGMRASTELWGGQLSLTLCPRGYVFKK